VQRARQARGWHRVLKQIRLIKRLDRVLQEVAQEAIEPCLSQNSSSWPKLKMSIIARIQGRKMSGQGLCVIKPSDYIIQKLEIG
jgi:hypothetical protein